MAHKTEELCLAAFSYVCSAAHLVIPSIQAMWTALHEAAVLHPEVSRVVAA